MDGLIDGWMDGRGGRIDGRDGMDGMNGWNVWSGCFRNVWNEWMDGLVCGLNGWID